MALLALLSHYNIVHFAIFILDHVEIGLLRKGSCQKYLEGGTTKMLGGKRKSVQHLYGEYVSN